MAMYGHVLNTYILQCAVKHQFNQDINTTKLYSLNTIMKKDALNGSRLRIKQTDRQRDRLTDRRMRWLYG